MLSVSKLGKSYAGRVLFSDVSFHVNHADRIGLIGPNGSGKTTLLRLLLGELEPDEGEVVLRRGAVLGYLPQEIAPSGDETVLELATSVTPEITALRHTLRREGENSEAGHVAQARLDELRLYELEPKARQILAGLSFRQADFNRPTRALSGGWIMRAHLARLLVQEPSLLMLDEPTNHLDIESLVWFQEYLRNYPGAILMISHDREFLNQLIVRVFEIAQSRVKRYRGNYDSYLQERAAREEQQLSAYKNQQKKIEALQLFADRFRAKATKAAQAQSKLKQIERMDKIESPVAAQKTITFHWPQPERTGQRVITLTDIHQSYGPVTVYSGLNYHVERGQRTVLVGPNGAGKSTLLKLLAGVIPFQRGARELGLRVKVGYYAQHRLEMLNPGHTVLEEALGSKFLASEQSARNVLGSFLFRGDDVFKRVSVLSGGEKSRRRSALRHARGLAHLRRRARLRDRQRARRRAAPAPRRDGGQQHRAGDHDPRGRDHRARRVPPGGRRSHGGDGGRFAAGLRCTAPGRNDRRPRHRGTGGGRRLVAGRRKRSFQYKI